jgi:hypothetical protein
MTQRGWFLVAFGALLIFLVAVTRLGAPMRLTKDILRCLKHARRDGRANFSVLGLTGVPSVRCNVTWSAEKGYLLVLSWLDGNRPSEHDALGLVTLFATAARPEGGLDGLAMLREEYEGAPGGKKMWHRTYTLPKTTKEVMH